MIFVCEECGYKSKDAIDFLAAEHWSLGKELCNDCAKKEEFERQTDEGTRILSEKRSQNRKGGKKKMEEQPKIMTISDLNLDEETTKKLKEMGTHNMKIFNKLWVDTANKAEKEQSEKDNTRGNLIAASFMGAMMYTGLLFEVEDLEMVKVAKSGLHAVGPELLEFAKEKGLDFEDLFNKAERGELSLEQVKNIIQQKGEEFRKLLEKAKEEKKKD